MTEEQIHILCKKYDIGNYTINDDMSIDVDGSVNLFNVQLEELPLKFRKVTRYFDCSDNKLTSLDGSPIEVGGNFSCYSNELTSLKGCPLKVGGNFDCDNNRLTTLEYGPIYIGGYFYCYNNQIFEEFKTKFNKDYNLYLKYTKRQKILKGILND